MQSLVSSLLNRGHPEFSLVAGLGSIQLTGFDHIIGIYKGFNLVLCKCLS
jgi:hypothetical protein